MPSGDNSGVTRLCNRGKVGRHGGRGHASFPPFEPLSTEHWQKRFILIADWRIRIRAYLLLVTTYSILYNLR